MAPGDANGSGSCGLSGEMEAASTWLGLQLPAYTARGSARHAGSCSLRFRKGALRVRGRRMEEVKAKEVEGGGFIEGKWGWEGSGSLRGWPRGLQAELAGLRDNLEGAAGSAWGAYGAGLKGCGPVWEGVHLPGGPWVALRGLDGANMGKLGVCRTL